MELFFTIVIWAVVAVLIVAALYLLLIMPRTASDKVTKPFLEWLYAHRGLHENGTDAPENSLKAFAKAVEAGFGMELDVQLSKDKVPVVFHDYTLKRMCGAEGKISDYTYDQLKTFSLAGSKERIPKLKEVLELVNGRMPLIVELKIERTDISVCREADKLLRDYKGMYCIESFNPLALRWYRRKRKDVVRGQLSDAFHKEGEKKRFITFILQHLMLNCLGKPDFIAYNHKYPKGLSRKLCRGMFKNTAAAWTIKSEEELAAAKKHFDLFIFDSFVPRRKTI